MGNTNWLHDLFIEEAKPALDYHSGDDDGPYIGRYYADMTYTLNDIVLLEGDIYRCIKENTGLNPYEHLGVYWELLYDGNIGGDVPIYNGEYVVTPNTHEDIVLDTDQKLLISDILVKKIPYSATSNNANGETVIIG